MTSDNKPALIKQQTSLEKLSPLQVYLREIGRYALLSPEEEYELAVQHHDKGDRNAAHRLVTANLRLVVKIANDFRQAQTHLLDLIQEGNAGLMQAVKRFNPYKGVKLSTYAAWWIRAQILKYIIDNKSQVKMGTTAAQRKLFFNLRKEAEKLLLEYDRVDPKLIAEKLDVKEAEVIEMQKRLSSPDVSLDAPVEMSSGSQQATATRGSLIASSEHTSEDLLEANQLREIFSEHLEEFQQSLNERDLQIFQDRLLSDEPVTLQQIGDKYGISRERARQLETKIIKNLKKFVDTKGVIDIDLE